MAHIEYITIEEALARKEQYRGHMVTEFMGYTEASALDILRKEGDPVAVIRGNDWLAVIYKPHTNGPLRDRTP